MRLRFAGLALIAAAFTLPSQFRFNNGATGAKTRLGSDKLAEIVAVTDFTGADPTGVSDSSAAFTNACAATTTGRLVIPPGTYLIASNVTCGAAVCDFQGGAQVSVNPAITFTANCMVVALGGSPNTGSGTFTYGTTTSFVINPLGLSLGDTASSNSDDFLHISRPVNSSSGINIRNDNTGASAQSYIHLWGGPINGGSQGAALRVSASSAAGGSLVNIVCENDAFCSIIQQAAAPLDFYTANVRQLQIGSVPSAVNYWVIKGGAAASSISTIPAGTDSNISVVHDTKGTGSHFFRTGVASSFQLEIKDTPSASRRVTITGSNGGDPTISTSSGNLAVGAPIAMVATAFASLGTPSNGVMTYCSDCTIANPCANAGTGALAKRLNGVWVCN